MIFCLSLSLPLSLSLYLSYLSAFMEPDELLMTSDHLADLNRQKRSPEASASDRTTLDDIEMDVEYSETMADDDMLGADTDEFGTRKRIKRQAPYIIYPEILVIVDYDGYRLHGGDNLQVLLFPYYYCPEPMIYCTSH